MVLSLASTIIRFSAAMESNMASSTESTNPMGAASALEAFWPSSNGATEKGGTSESNLRQAIEHCKEMVLQAPEHSPERKQLVRVLVSLRKQLLDLKEGPEEPFEPIANINGHRFVDPSTVATQKTNVDVPANNRYCDQCDQMIWSVVQPAYQCTACGYLCHRRCANLILRACVALKVADNPVYILDICPEKGLAGQRYRCAECRTRLSIDENDGFTFGRLCDYSGLYYCQKCHWNDTVVVPARMIRNWDFQPRQVSRVALQFLTLMRRKPVLRLEALNPHLFNYVQELRDVKKLRSDIIIMKPFIMCCREAASNLRLFSHLKPYTHFIDNVDVYSIQDLLDLQAGVLERHLRRTVEIFAKHIRECPTCRGNGYICELCSDSTVLFSFDDFVSSCKLCSALFHRICFEQHKRVCPRCQRRKRRQSEDLDDDAMKTKFDEEV